jgi:hypothetical protein
MSAANGGAIELGPSVEGTITETLFIRCRAVGLAGVGGAICSEATNLNCSRCCAVECQAVSAGYVVGVSRPSSHQLDEMSFVSCGNLTESGASVGYGSVGAIYTDLDVVIAVARFNATSCFGNDQGSVLYGGAGASTCYLRYLNVDRCMGRYSILRLLWSSPSLIEYCNIYSNTLERMYDAIVYVNDGEQFTFDHCIFSGNSTVAFIAYYTGGFYSVTNCVFSGRFPGVVSSSDGNVAYSVTESWVIYAIVTFGCSGVYSPSQSPHPTILLTSSDSFTRSIQFQVRLTLLQVGWYTLALITA